jgi:hypothetical protein
VYTNPSFISTGGQTKPSCDPRTAVTFADKHSSADGGRDPARDYVFNRRNPPSIGKSVPVTKDASSDAR